MTSFTIAAAQYPVEALDDWESYALKIECWVGDAARRGARLAVFPEYGAMELASLDPATMNDLQGSIHFVSALVPKIDALHSTLAVQYGLHILAATAPVQHVDGSFRNRARLFAPGGKVGVQDKLIMTRFEREELAIVGGDVLNVFDTALGRIGVCICYDCEFPLIARAMVESGADMLLVPSCTDTIHGYERVRIGARARALEGQCYVMQAPTVGTAPWSPAIDVNRGSAGIFAPPDNGFPEDGIVAEGTMDEAGWVIGEINVKSIENVRKTGAVLNVTHWRDQPGGADDQTAIVRVVDLS